MSFSLNSLFIPMCTSTLLFVFLPLFFDYVKQIGNTLSMIFYSLEMKLSGKSLLNLTHSLQKIRDFSDMWSNEACFSIVFALKLITKLHKTHNATMRTSQHLYVACSYIGILYASSSRKDVTNVLLAHYFMLFFSLLFSSSCVTFIEYFFENDIQ